VGSLDPEPSAGRGDDYQSHLAREDWGFTPQT